MNMNLPQRSALLKQPCATQLRRAHVRSQNQIVCKSKASRSQRQEQEENEHSVKASGVAAATLAASILLASAAVPQEALAARSGGRAGGSAFRSAPRAAAPRASPRSGPSIQNRSYNYNFSPAPPIGGYGYGGGFGYGYGGGGISLFPTFVSPVGGGLFQLFFFAIIASTLIGIVRSVLGGRREKDDWDD